MSYSPGRDETGDRVSLEHVLSLTMRQPLGPGSGD